MPESSDYSSSTSFTHIEIALSRKFPLAPTVSKMVAQPPLCSYCHSEKAELYDKLNNGWCKTCKVRGYLINWAAQHQWLKWVQSTDCQIALGQDSWQAFVLDASEKDILAVLLRIVYNEKRLQASADRPPRTLNPIETEFNGYRFRSRLEARWAVFLTALGVVYYYEHEGFNLEGKQYLPDFWLPALQCFIEIKGAPPTEEEQRLARLLALTAHKPVYLFAGNVGLPTQADGYSSWKFDSEVTEPDFWWSECQDCRTIGLYRPPDLHARPCTCVAPETLTPESFVDLVSTYRCNSSRLVAAYNRARGARFEHGETPEALPIPLQ